MRALLLALPFSLSAVACSASQATTSAPTTAAVGSPAPDFTLPGLDDAQVSLSDYAGKTVVLEWFNPGCPFVKDVHGSGKMGAVAGQWVSESVVWLAINSGAPGKQGTGAEKNQEASASWGLSYPVLLDESGVVGRSYGAKTTPHMYVIAPDGTLAYAGAFSNAPMGRVDGDSEVNFVSEALTNLAAGEPVATPEAKPWGCSVKYGG